MTSTDPPRTIRAIVIRPDDGGCVEDIEDTLPAYQKIVGGYIEQVGTQHVSIWLNEEGKLKGLPVDELATTLRGADHRPVRPQQCFSPANHDRPLPAVRCRARKTPIR
jgi:hypothetical protein